MKNKFLKYFLLILFLFEIDNIVFANEFTFDSKEINISGNGNIINASEGTATSLKDNNKIRAKSFQYNNSTSILLAKNVIAELNKKTMRITSGQLLYNKDLSLITASKNVQVNDLLENITLKSEKFIFDIVNQIITSNNRTEITDKFGNLFIVKNFKYEIDNSLIKINGVNLTTTDKNVYEIKKAYVDLKSDRLIGKDISINFNNLTFREGNQPRLKGSSISLNPKTTEIKNGVFTACKKNDTCPPWQLSAKNIKHDKEKKIIYYERAWLNLYDKPILYFPKFYHPDPTVKKQSGFLMPSFENSKNTGSSLSLPYYHLIANNRDLTIKPKFFTENKMLLQSEYRHVTKNSNNIFDFSLLSDVDSSSKNHFFSKSKRKINIGDFEESELNLELQMTSNDTYLKSYKVKSPLINNVNLLTTSIGVKAYGEQSSFDVGFYAYENLSKSKNDRFEFIYPSYNFAKSLDNKTGFAGNFLFNSSGFIKQYNTNVFERVVINDFIYNSSPQYEDSGIKNNFNILVKNTNTRGVRSEKYKDSENQKIATIMEFNSSYPLKKFQNNYENILTPKFSLKYSPNSTKDIKKEERRTDVNNIFNINRIMADDTVEGGASFTYGVEFTKLINNRSFFDAKIANAFRLEENKNLPRNSSLGKKTSDIVGEINFDPYDILNIGYNFSTDENLKDQKYQKLDTTIKLSNLTTSFEYLNENNTANSESYLSNKTVYNLSKSDKFSYETRLNKKTRHTEFYNLVYEYENDCLTAAIEYNKDYYDDRDLKPEKNIFFKLTIVPFGKVSSPSLNK